LRKKRRGRRKRKRGRGRGRKYKRYSGLKRSKSFEVFGTKIEYNKTKWFFYTDAAYSSIKPAEVNERFELEATLFDTASADSTVNSFKEAYTVTVGGGMLVDFKAVSLDSSLEFNYFTTNKVVMNMQYIASMAVDDKEIFTRTSYISAMYFSLREAIRWRNLFFKRFDLFAGFSVGYSPSLSLNHSFVVNEANAAAVDFESVNMKFEASTMVTEFFLGAYYEPFRSWFVSLQLGMRTLECIPVASDSVDSAQFVYTKGEPMKDQLGEAIKLNISSSVIKLGLRKEF
jgi:hypothetical protein